MKLGKDEKDQTEKAAMYDIISSPSKDSTKLTLRLSRVRSSDLDQQDDMLSGLENSSVSEGDIPFNVQYPGQTSKTPVTPQDVNRPLNAAQCLPQHEQTAFLQAQQVPVLQQNTSVAAKQPQTPVVQTQQQVSQQGTITSYDEVELDALAEIERIERESAIERERFSKEVQDKGKRIVCVYTLYIILVYIHIYIYAYKTHIYIYILKKNTSFHCHIVQFCLLSVGSSTTFISIPLQQ